MSQAAHAAKVPCISLLRRFFPLTHALTRFVVIFLHKLIVYLLSLYSVWSKRADSTRRSASELLLLLNLIRDHLPTVSIPRVFVVRFKGYLFVVFVVVAATSDHKLCAGYE